MPKDLKVKSFSMIDRKLVNMLSTIHGPDMVDLPPNCRGEVRGNPQVILDYWGMEGVNLSDQLTLSYSTARKANKQCQNVFYRLFDMVVVNAYVVHS